jgi:uncharacterized membrane protein SirB2
MRRNGSRAHADAVDAYTGLKTLHIATAALSISGFLLRGLWMWRNSPLLGHRLTRVLPHINDAVLLLAAVGLVVLTGQYPFVVPWVTAKVLALVLYIALGMIALRRGRTRALRTAALIGALLTFGYVLAVALTRRPWPLAGIA